METWLWITIGVLLLVIAGGASVLAAQRDELERAWNAVYTAVDEADQVRGRLALIHQKLAQVVAENGAHKAFLLELGRQQIAKNEAAKVLPLRARATKAPQR